MSLNFEKYAAKGNEFVNLVAESLNVPRDKAGRIVRAVLHALRNRLSHEESFQLLAQLPMALKGVYVDGWIFDKDFNRIHHLSDFIDEVRKEDGGLAGYDFGNDDKARYAVAAVFKGLNFFVSEGEMDDLINVMPQELKKFIKESIAGKETIF
ncbi:MAG TPA: DUF2267 domain-containing protein [Chitinophagaceae bacterium]|nr:DUF2267 domain-containing protein [Chitinophagaceae bacterium]